MNELYELMTFQGYATRNLDEAAFCYQERFEEKPKAFMVRSPFRISGSSKNKELIVLSPKCGGYAAIYIPTKLDKQHLEEVLSKIEAVSRKQFVERRKLEIIVEQEDMRRQYERKFYERHCNYCGSRYKTTVLEPEQHCWKSDCRMKHKEYLEEVKLRNKEWRERARAKRKQDEQAKEKETRDLPDFTMETPVSSSLQGWIYFIEAANGYVKIGRSDDPSKRFIDITNMSPVPLWLRHTIFSDNYVLAEARAHRLFSEYRKHGEWFELPANIWDRCLDLDHYDLDVD